MEFSELERVIRLHKKAYEILLWLKQAARSMPINKAQDVFCVGIVSIDNRMP